ncbi:hypothetical protein [Luteithermobacter gelatinilyticus]|uniref:hypothetical protein n=1 Tax=Luteithermobacter gelatinilyticus TaxID=2582913 RepID=UPI00110741F4|nr:hypothetical protein [Luteithermobacter gelatinilyticus]|tara:strand:+ start:13393 stop:13710 length:318 start_codon:yes stop_codon:yes gene_type:complete
MDFSALAWVGWIAFLCVAWPYATHARHPQLKPVEAYLIFVTVFIVLEAGALLFVSLLFWTSSESQSLLETIWAGIVAGLIMVVPAFLGARYMIRRPPRRKEEPPE